MKRLNRICRLAMVSALCGAGCLGAHAEYVGMRQARTMARNFFNAAKGYITAPAVYVYNGKDLAENSTVTPFYIFNSPSGGFVVIAADNKAFPILGYSLSNSFDKSRMTEQMKSVLTDFAHDVEMVRYDSRMPREAAGSWTSFPSLVMDILGNPENDDFYSVKLYGNEEGEWMARRYATEFDFEIAQPATRSIDTSYPESITLPEAPIVVSNIGGHFALSLPVEIERVIVYNLAGSAVLHKTFRDTNLAHLDLASEPYGFYIALLIDKNGVAHATKLYR